MAGPGNHVSGAADNPAPTNNVEIAVRQRMANEWLGFIALMYDCFFLCRAETTAGLSLVRQLTAILYSVLLRCQVTVINRSSPDYGHAFRNSGFPAAQGRATFLTRPASGRTFQR